MTSLHLKKWDSVFVLIYMPYNFQPLKQSFEMQVIYGRLEAFRLAQNTHRIFEYFWGSHDVFCIKIKCIIYQFAALHLFREVMAIQFVELWLLTIVLSVSFSKPFERPLSENVHIMKMQREVYIIIAGDGFSQVVLMKTHKK